MNHRSKAIAILVMLAMFIGCSKKGTETETPPETIIADNVTVIEEGGPIILESIDSTVYHFSFTGAPPDLQPGDIIVGSTGQGYLRKVTAATVDSNSMTIYTDSAALSDAIIRGSMQTNIQLNWHDGLGLGDESEARLLGLMPGATITQDGLDFSGLAISIVGEDSAGNPAELGTLTFTSGHIDFEPSLDFGFQIENARIEEFHAIASGECNIDLDAETVLYEVYSAHGDTTLASFEFPPWIVWVGVPPVMIPIVIVVRLDFVAGYDFHAGTLEFHTGFNATASTEFGASYQNSQWSTVWNRELTASGHETGVSLHLDMDAKGYVGPKVSLTIMGVAGPWLMVDDYARLDGEAGQEEWHLGLFAGVEGSVGFEVRILSWLLASYYADLFAYDLFLWETSGPIEQNHPPNQPSNPTPPDGSIDQSTNVDLSWDCSDPDGDPLTYDIYFGTISPPPLASSNQSQASYDPGQLEYDTLYYWRIIAKDNHQHSIEGVIWNFATAYDSMLSEQIAFSSNRDGNLEIYLMNPDGSNIQRLTFNNANDWDVVWSSDRSKIAFSSARDGNDEIYTMESDGSNQQRLTYHSAIDRYPSWSPDGTKIVFSSARDGNLELYLMDSNGSNIQRLTNNGVDDIDPSWSPDGSRIAYSSNPDGSYNYEIFMMNSDGSNQHQITYNSYFSDHNPSWSPNGNEIAFAASYQGIYSIYVILADGSNQHRITFNGSNRFPAWSPDGARIVFSSNRDGNYEIYVMDSNGGNQQRLTFDGGWDWDPTWSPAIAQ